jgi:hypothetical protein
MGEAGGEVKREGSGETASAIRKMGGWVAYVKAEASLPFGKLRVAGLKKSPEI